MNYRITLNTTNSAGVLARVIRVLRGAGLEFRRHRHSERNFGLRLEVEADGELASTSELHAVLAAVEGVNDVIHIQAHDPTGERAAIDADIVNQLVTAFPVIKKTLDAYAQNLKPRQRAGVLQTIGVVVGHRRCPELVDSEPMPVDLALDVFAIPLLEGVAEAQVEDGGLRVHRSAFTTGERRQLGLADALSVGTGSTDIRRCDFLAGYIEGILQHATRNNDVHVTETHCRHEGQPFCHFAVEYPDE